jgi:hypothetical protein
MTIRVNLFTSLASTDNDRGQRYDNFPWEPVAQARARLLQGRNRRVGSMVSGKKQTRGAESEPDNPLLRRFEERLDEVLGDDTPTVLMDPDSDSTDGDPAQTRLLGGRDGGKDDPLRDPPVGLLLVLAGPGRGHALPFGYGMNSLGRGEDQRVRLDFGDERISRTGHAVITYDGAARKFYLQHGGGASLTYLGDEPVLTPVELTGREQLRLGDTVLLFIPLCGPEFDWQDLPD